MAKEITWHQALGPHAFDENLAFQLKYPHNKNVNFAAAETGINCLRCQTLTPLAHCTNCGSDKYVLGLDPARHVGLFCVECDRGFTSVRCDCGCDNPVSHATLFKASTGGACFIVTAAAGDRNAPEVLLLSAFRDERLMPHRLGHLVVHAYYRCSPPIARLIARSTILQRATLRLIVRPIIHAITARHGNNTGRQRS